jgi:UDP-glucose 4-epimerase
LLITGGTGSFGEAVLKKFLKTNIKEIRIFSRDEKKQEDMRLKYKNNKLKFYIGDIRDEKSVNNVCEGVDYIFHAAALKQVPSCEFFPLEAVKTNIIGTENLISASNKNKVKRVVVLSTDKAVYPVNAMGMSKAMAEKIVIARSRLAIKKSPILCCTRYGNVIGSRGSVIPLFINQAIKGEKITITDPKMTRFLMTLDESVELVLYAFKNAKQGDIFVQKSPSTNIENLAIAIKEIFNSSSKIEIIGTRHGEKLYETLISREEMFRVSNLRKHFVISADTRDLNYEKYFTKGRKEISKSDDYNSHNVEILKKEQVKEKLIKLDFVREYL